MMQTQWLNSLNKKRKAVETAVDETEQKKARMSFDAKQELHQLNKIMEEADSLKKREGKAEEINPIENTSMAAVVKERDELKRKFEALLELRNTDAEKSLEEFKGIFCALPRS